MFLGIETKAGEVWVRQLRTRESRRLLGKETPINFLIYHDIQHNYTIYIKIEERTSSWNVSWEFSSSFCFLSFCCAGDFRADGCLRQLTYKVISFRKGFHSKLFLHEIHWEALTKRITIYKIAGGQLNRIKILHYAYNRSAKIK